MPNIITKQPREHFYIGKDFTNDLAESGGTIDISLSLVFEYKLVNNNYALQEVNEIVEESTLRVSSNGKILEVNIKEGLDQERYKVSLLAVSDLGEGFESEIFVRIKED